MRWWRRKEAEPSPAVAEADRRLHESRERLAGARGDDREVAAVVEELRALRRKNRFGAMISDALRGT